MQKIKIGFIDSGVGGLFFASDLIASLIESKNLFVSHFFQNCAEFIHFGDTKNMPYGLKTKEQLDILVKDLLNLAENAGCKIVFIACNTADTVLTDGIIADFEKRGVKLVRILQESAMQIVKKTKDIEGKKNILVLATKRTIESNKYQDEIRKYSDSLFPGVKTNIIGYSPQNLEFSIENGVQKEELRDFIEKFYKEHRSMIDSLSSIGLFCTHFPYFANDLREFLKKIKNTKIKIFGQGALFKGIAVKLCKSSIDEYRAKSTKEGEQLKKIKDYKICIKSFLTSPRDINLYNNIMKNFNEKLKVEFSIL
jgi:glutamate racemase